ncbi:MAG: adenylate/guanylate cyclase domain-containing protein [Kiritimatiellae bacterium]|nr:adenylate/guanylate cyclase domain-containing protein [Kiritimatiellia bacterium]
MLKRAIQGVLIGLLAAGAAVALWQPGWLDAWENATWAWRAMYFAGSSPAADSIRLIFLDEKSLDWAMRENRLGWPWPRELYAPILSFCRRAGAKAVAFDVLYTEPSFWGVEDDAALGAAIAETPGFVGTCSLGEETGNTNVWPAHIRKPALKIGGIGGWLATADTRPIHHARALFPIPDVATNAALLANVQVPPDRDGIYRRAPVLDVFDGQVVPSLALALRLAAEPATPVSIEPGWFRVGKTAVPIDRSGRAILRYRGRPEVYRAVSAAAVIQSELRIQQADQAAPVLQPDFFKDCYVLFGCTALGLFDYKPTPVGGAYPGVVIHATMLDNLLWKEFLRDVPGWAALALAAGLAVLGGVLVRCSRAAWQSALAFVLLAPVPFLLGFAAYSRGFWLPVAMPGVALGLALVGGLVVDYATEGRQRRFIRGAFGQYLSSAVIEELVRHPERLKLGGQRRALTIYFSDIEGFTTISERMTPEDLTALLNDYLSAMTDIIQEEGGTVDKFEGDAIVAFWNAPLDVPDHALRAVRAALRCQAKLGELRLGFRVRAGRDLFMRIGLNTGHAVVGNMGSASRFDYTVLGDAANLASRLEGINKQFGTYILISEATKDALGGAFPAREVSRVAVVGRRDPVRVFEPMTQPDFDARERDLAVFADGLKLYYDGRFEDARTTFERIMETDRAAAAYFRQCRTLRADQPREWNGVWVMTQK